MTAVTRAGRDDRLAALSPPVLLVAAVVGMALIRIVIASTTGLTEDEAYYRLWGLAPAAGYLDHPPMTGWLIAIGQAIAGDTALGVRLMAVLLPVAGAWFLWRSAAILFDRTVANRAVAISLAMPLLAAGSVIMTPDTPSVFFWGLTSWALVELWRSQRPGWWLALGVFAGLGLLAKYTNLFAGAGVVLWLVAVPAARRWFQSWQLWVGGVLAFVLASPMIAWNYAHDWASFAKQFGRVGAGDGLTLNYLGELAGGMIALASPVIAVLAAIGLVASIRLVWRERDPRHAILLAGIVPMGLYFLQHALHDRVQANWPAPLYPTLAVLAALAIVAIEEAGAAQSVHLRRFAKAALPVGFGIIALLYLHVLRPIVVVAGERDPTSQMRGWETVAGEVERLRQAAGAAWIATTSYAVTGELAFQEAQHEVAGVPVVQLNERLRYVNLPEPPAALLTRPALYVELERRVQPAWLSRRFASVTRIGRVERRYAGTLIASYDVYRLADPIAPVLDPVSAR